MLNIQQPKEEQFDRFHWQMSIAEQIAMKYILGKIKPKVSVEVGTYKGGSLQVLSHFSNRVISIDIDSNVKYALESYFNNVQFIAGDSGSVLTQILYEQNKLNIPVEFILLDGAHSTNGILRDIKALENWQPLTKCILMIHDSFNPFCRKGILQASWDSLPYVHNLEIDYISGTYFKEAFDTAKPRTMWGGLAMAEIYPYKREGQLPIRTSQQDLFDLVYSMSSHKKRLARIILSKIKKYLISN